MLKVPVSANNCIRLIRQKQLRIYLLPAGIIAILQQRTAAVDTRQVRVPDHEPDKLFVVANDNERRPKKILR